MQHQAHSGVEAALELARAPYLAEAIRLQPLPQDVLALIRVAAGCSETSLHLAEASGREVRAIEEAAPFYLEQMLFQADAGPYRTLGTAPGASREELREHLCWLMKWLHPDRHGPQWESVFAGRVLAAWQELQTGAGTPGARPIDATDEAASKPRPRWVASPVTDLPVSGPQLAMLIVAWSIVLALVLVPDFRKFWSPFEAAVAEFDGDAQAKFQRDSAEAR